MKDNTPFKLSVKHWGTKITISKDRSDLHFEEYVEMLRELSRAIGWSEKDINELFGS